MQLKRFLSIALAVVLLISCMAFIVACEDANVNVNVNVQNPTEAPTQLPTDTPTEAPTEEPVDTRVEYTVTVKDTDGNTVSGVRVTICSEASCFNPIVTDSEGVVSMKLEPADGYKAKVSKADGYTFSDEYTLFESGETSIVIIITKICEHENTEKLAAVAATCTSDGLTEGSKCADCGEVLVAQTKLDALGHTEEIVKEAQEATCTSTGLTAEVKCSVCKETLYTQTEIAILEHKPEVIEAVDPTCESYGSTEGSKCSLCNEYLVEPEKIDKLPHTPGPEATCTSEQSCTICKYTIERCRPHSYANPYNGLCMVCGKAETEREIPTQVANPFFNTITVGQSNTVSFDNFTSGNFTGVTISSVDKESGVVNISDLFAGINISLSGYVGFDAYISKFGYYIDEDHANSCMFAPQNASSDIKEVAGKKAKVFNITVNTKGMTTGDHKITFFAQFGNGVYVDLTTWNVTVLGKDGTSDKPVANVIIISGQSNAFGASPIKNVDAQYNNKAYNNVYIHYNNINVLNGKWQTLFSNNGFEAYRGGMGGGGYGYIGPELGIVEYLSAHGYTDDAPLYIIKFTAAGTYLNGQWFPTDSNYDLDPEDLVDDMGDYLYNQMTSYIYESLAVISKDYNPQIQSFFWVQGESDASHVPVVAEDYERYEQLLVSSIRTDFDDYASSDGISFVNYAIQETLEGDPNGTNFPHDHAVWPHAEALNNSKKANCEYWFDYDNDGELISNDKANIESSYLILADNLLTKASVGEDMFMPDYAHLSGPDMFKLGFLMGEGMLFLEEISPD